MQVEILHRPSFAVARVTLTPGEEIIVEGGAMVSMSAEIEMKTKARGGLLSSLKRAFLGGESFFLNTYRATDHPGEILLAPPLPGDMVAWDLQAQTILLQSGSFVACGPEISLDTKWGGAKTFFAGEGLFMLKVSGTGTLILSSYGAIQHKELAAGERYIVDTGHIVAFSAEMPFKVRRVGGLKSTLFSGEGLVVELTGPGHLWLQTRSVEAFLSWLIPKLPQPSSSSS